MKYILDKISQRWQKGIRIRTLIVLMIVLACGVSLMLLHTIQRTAALVGVPDADQAVLASLLLRQKILTGVLLAVTLLAILSVVLLILRPMREYVSRISANETLPTRGAYELRYMARAYNEIYEENRRHNDSLQYEVEHDALTGLYNRGAFDRLREELKDERIALLLIDVDQFKSINDTYGHTTGDKVLRDVANRLSRSFRATDYPCRIGGDEFAVIMTDMTPELRYVVISKIERVVLAHHDRRSDDLPKATLSIGVAFNSQRKSPEDDLFKLADEALYYVKEHGRDGYRFYEDDGT